MSQDRAVALKVTSTFEQCIEVAWEVVPASKAANAGKTPFADSVVEMVITHQQPDSEHVEPPANAMRKRVECGTDTTASIGNMPMGRAFLISVISTLHNGEKVRSPWVRTATLVANENPEGIHHTDLFGRMRLECLLCSCQGYVQDDFHLGSTAAKARCRRCGCQCNDHKKGLLENEHATLNALAKAYCQESSRENCTELPVEALRWDKRECDLWFMSDGCFHPRNSKGQRQNSIPKGSPTDRGAGLVSVITPTSQSRQKYHELLWKNFDAQDWSSKELIVVETYEGGGPSPFFTERLKSDSRITYIGFDRSGGSDLSIGLKRNIGIHLASGEYIAHFDDDDLYAPNYLNAMIRRMRTSGALAVTLSTWFILDVVKNIFAYCDPITLGKQKGQEPLKEHLYGYGFSYVYRREAALEVPFGNRDMGEDYDFFCRLMTLKGFSNVVLHEDKTGICLHTQHDHNTSKSFKLRDVPREEVSSLDVGRSPGFDRYLEVSGWQSGLVHLMESFVPWFADHPGTAALIAADLMRGLGPVSRD